MRNGRYLLTEMSGRRVRRRTVARDDHYGITLGEIARDLAEMKTQVTGDLASLRRTVDSNLVSRDVYEARHTSVTDRVSKLEQSRDQATTTRVMLSIGVLTSLVASGAGILVQHLH
jgi:hypothetical protein